MDVRFKIIKFVFSLVLILLILLFRCSVLVEFCVVSYKSWVVCRGV